MFRLLAAFFRCITVHGCSIGCVLHRQNTTDERSLGIVDLFALPFAFHYQVVETHVHIRQSHSPNAAQYEEELDENTAEWEDAAHEGGGDGMR